MSHVSLSRRDGASRFSAVTQRLFILIATLVAVLAGGPAVAHAEENPVTRTDLCRAWSAPSTNPEITLSSGLTVSAARLQRIGTSCLASNAEIRLLGAEVVEETGTSGPNGTAAASVLAAITHAAGTEPDLKEGDELFKGAYLRNFNASLKFGYFEISGAVEISWSGGNTSRFLFKGKLYGVNRFVMNLYSPAGGTYLPNVGGTPVSYTGVLELDAAGYRLTLEGEAPSIVIGTGDKQLSVTNAALALSLAEDKLKLDVVGKIGVGAAVSADGQLEAFFDGTGMSTLSGSGALAVTIPAKGSSPEGSISGDATFSYTREPLARSITFTGDVRLGEAFVAGATGNLDDQSVTFAGNAEYTSTALKAKGAIDGVAFYGDNLAGRTIANKAGQQVQATKGDALLKAASGEVTTKGIDVKGAVQIGNVGDEAWVTGSGAVDLSFQAGTQPETTIKGNASVDWLIGGVPTVTFEGSIASGSTTVANAKGVLDGKKIAFAGDVTLANADLTVKGAIDGVVFYGADLSGETIKNRAGTDVPASQGDFLLKTASASITTNGFALSGNASLGRVGGERFAKGGGAVDATYGATNLKGSAELDWVAGELPAVSFTGAVSNGGVEVASATGSVDGNKLAFKGAAQATLSGVSVKGAVDGIVYYGSDLAGQTITNRAGAQVPATKGDFLLKSASADLASNGFTLTGAAQVGSVDGELWVKGGGAVDLTYGESNLNGTAQIDWVKGKTPAITFDGAFTSPETTIAAASGTFDGNKIDLTGVVSFAKDGFAISGAVDGVLYYGTDLSGESVPNRNGDPVTPKRGDFVLRSAAGQFTVKGLSAGGAVSIANLNGDVWAYAGGYVEFISGATEIAGNIDVAWLKGSAPAVSFAGSVKSGDVTVASAEGTIDGKKVAFKGDVQVAGSGIAAKGAVDGIAFFGADLAGETITNRAGAEVPATKGDFLLKSASGELVAKGLTVSGAITVGKVAGELWVKGGGAVDLTLGTTNVKGSAEVNWVAGQVPAVSFTGSVKSGDIDVASAAGTIDGKKIALTAAGQLVNPSLSIKGTVDVIVFYGNDLAGETIANRAGTQVPATKGDILLKGASADIVAQGFTLKGAVSFGKVGTQLWAKGGGSVDLVYGATALKGSADVDWVAGQVPSVAFSGSLTNGTSFVGNATGVVDGKKIALKGMAKVTDPAGTIEGAVDGVLFYGNDLAGQTIENRAGQLVEPLKGDYNLKGASGSVVLKGLTLTGGIALGNVRGDKWATGGGSVDIRFTQNGIETRIQGSASSDASGTVKFSGSIAQGTTVVASASGTVDGNKLTFEGQLSTPTLSGKATGAIYYGNDLAGQTIANRAGTMVQAQRGDFAFAVTDGRATLKQLLATANFTVSRVGSEWWVKAAAQIKVGDNWLTFSGDIDSSGNILLKGNGSITMDGYRLEFAGTALVRNNALVLDGTVAIVTNLFKVQLTGTIEKPDMTKNQYWFTGKASFTFGKFKVIDATVRLVFGEGLTTAFSIKTCFLFICPSATYKLYFTGGAITRAELNAPIAWVPQFLVIGSVAMPGVPISTKITGII